MGGKSGCVRAWGWTAGREEDGEEVKIKNQEEDRTTKKY